VNKWLVALIVLVGSFVVAAVVSRVAKKLLSAPSRPDVLQGLADVISKFAFSAVVAAGLMAAAGVGSPESVRPIPGRLIAYFPKVLVAGALVIVGNVAGTLVGLAAGRAALKATGAPRPSLERIVRTVIMALFVVIAVGQLGVDTRIVQLLLSGIVYSFAAAAALLVGLGGREVARHLAAGRSVRSTLQLGDHVEVAGVSGRVVAVRPTSVELEQADGGVLVVPHGRAIEAIMTVRRAPTSPGPKPV
jgi:small-conductance mechanosensitive channel